MIVLGFCYAVLQAKRPSVDLFFIVKPITAENVYMWEFLCFVNTDAAMKAMHCLGHLHMSLIQRKNVEPYPSSPYTLYLAWS